jgi:hypothetical protein
LELSSVCVVDGTGKIACERKMASEPEALVALLWELGVTRIGFKPGPLAQRLSRRSEGSGLCGDPD